MRDELVRKMMEEGRKRDDDDGGREMTEDWFDEKLPSQSV